MRHLYLCEMVLHEPTDNSVTFLCVGKPEGYDGPVAGQVALGIALDSGATGDQTYDSVMRDVLFDPPKFRFARLPRQLVPDTMLRQMIVFDTEALRRDDLRPLDTIPDDVN